MAETKLNNLMYFVYTLPAVCNLQLIKTWRQVSRGFVDDSEKENRQTQDRHTSRTGQNVFYVVSCYVSIVFPMKNKRCFVQPWNPIWVPSKISRPLPGTTDTGIPICSQYFAKQCLGNIIVGFTVTLMAHHYIGHTKDWTYVVLIGCTTFWLELYNKFGLTKAIHLFSHIKVKRGFLGKT